jgi:hypothetical protein
MNNEQPNTFSSNSFAQDKSQSFVEASSAYAGYHDACTAGGVPVKVRRQRASIPRPCHLPSLLVQPSQFL